MTRVYLRLLFIIAAIAFFSGCDTGSSAIGIYIPDELDGYWNLSGTVIGRDGSFPTQIDQDFEIRNNKIYLEDSDEEWTGSYSSPYLRINFDRIVQEEEIVGCGQVVTTGKITVQVFMTSSDESSYDASAVGLFETDSECDGVSNIELEGTLVLTPQ